VGDAAFIGPPGNYPYFVAFKKGKGSGSVATYSGATAMLLTIDQVKKVAQQIASGM
jgi:glycerol-3-phosphate acyltransferase PlsY